MLEWNDSDHDGMMRSVCLPDSHWAVGSLRGWVERAWRSSDRRWSSTSPLATDRRKRSVASPVSRTMPGQGQK